MPADISELAQRAHEALAALRLAALSECGHEPGAGRPQPAPARLLWQEEMTPEDLAEEMLRLAAESVSEYQAFRNGHVYCYSCLSAACGHSAPGGPGEVFAGYAGTGRPVWEEFFNYLLHIGDHRTDQLFAERPEILVRVLGRARLVADQLTSFGKNSLTYRIWGQVVAGYFQVRGLRVALSAQLVETQDHRLHLQVLADERLVEDMAHAGGNTAAVLPRVHDALAEARRQVYSLGTLWQTGNRQKNGTELREKAFATLRHLAHSIERKGRQQVRRTAHAETRGRENRPIHKADDDLKNASANDLFRDMFKNSVIVRGRGDRIHVFSDDARHITSMMIKGDEFERRLRRKRYLPLTPDEANRLRTEAKPRPDARGQ